MKLLSPNESSGCDAKVDFLLNLLNEPKVVKKSILFLFLFLTHPCFQSCPPEPGKDIEGQDMTIKDMTGQDRI